MSDSAIKRLRVVDYVEREYGAWIYNGFSCYTCSFFDDINAPSFDGPYCTNPVIKAKVEVNGCCNAWDGEVVFAADEKRHPV